MATELKKLESCGWQYVDKPPNGAAIYLSPPAHVSASAAAAAAAAAAAPQPPRRRRGRGCDGGGQSHRAGWLEQNLEGLAISDAFGRFRAILTFWRIFSRFGMFFRVFGRFWSVSDLGFGLGNNPRRQVFEETGIWRLH